MRITIEIERPQKVLKVFAVVAALAVAVAGAGVVMASHLFADVPTSSAFHTPIAAIARAGLTVGCGGGNFCPDLPITRAQEAALLHRGLSRVAMYTHEAQFQVTTTTYFDLGSVTIAVPGSNGLGIGANQFVKLDAHVTFTTGCGRFTISLDNDTDTSTVYAKQTNVPVVDNAEFYRMQSVSTTYVFPASPGPHTYYFRLTHGPGDCVGPPMYAEQVLIVATTHAFGATGHDVLGGS